MLNIKQLIKLKNFLDNAKIPTADRTIIVPTKLNRKTYKGRGRPKNTDYIPVFEI